VNWSGCSLTFATINGDLTNANLSGADLTNANLYGANFTGANLSGVTWSHTICPDNTASDDDGGTCAGHL